MPDEPLSPLPVSDASATAAPVATAAPSIAPVASVPVIGSKPPAETPDPVAAFQADTDKNERRNERRRDKRADAKPADAVAEIPTGEHPTDAAPAVVEGAAVVEPQVHAAPETKTEQPAPAADEAPAVERPQARTYAEDERIALGANPDGSPLEWTRKQITDELREVPTLRERADQASKYQSVFGISAEECERDWKPLLASLAAAPYTVPFLQQIVDAPTPDKVAYLEECAKFFDTQRPTAEKPAAGSGVPDEVTQRITALERDRDRAVHSARVMRVQSEAQRVSAKYPFLKSDQALAQTLERMAAARFDHLLAQGVPEENIHALLDIIEENKALLDAKLIAHQQGVVPGNPAPPAAPSALLAGGASPGATRKPERKPQVYTSLEDATAAFIADHPD